MSLKNMNRTMTLLNLRSYRIVAYFDVILDGLHHTLQDTEALKAYPEKKRLSTDLI
jgi:hypothetical protein